MASFESLERKIAALPDDTFRVLNSASSRPSESELSALESTISRRFSPGLQELLSKWGVLVVEGLPKVWPRPVELDVAPAWRFRYALRVLGVGTSVPIELKIESTRNVKLDEARPPCDTVSHTFGESLALGLDSFGSGASPSAGERNSASPARGQS